MKDQVQDPGIEQEEGGRCQARSGRIQGLLILGLLIQNVKLPKVVAGHVQERLHRQYSGFADALFQVIHFGEFFARELANRGIDDLCVYINPVCDVARYAPGGKDYRAPVSSCRLKFYGK